MRFRIGDKVKFLNETGGGIITAFLDEKTVEIQTEDGFDRPVLASEILLDNSESFGFDKGETNTQQVTNEPEEISVVNLKPEDYKYKTFSGDAILAIVPENEKLLHVSNFMLYLINDSNYSFQYIVSQNEGKVSELIESGIIEPDTKMVIKKYNQSSISKVKELRLQGLFFKEGLFDHKTPIDKSEHIGDISFYKGNSFKENDYFNSKAIVFIKEEVDLKAAIEELNDSDFIKISKSKETVPDKPKIKRAATQELFEVDLHIEEIVDNHVGMSNGEILEVQLGRFETSLATAIKSKTKRIVFIHGVGNGKLKYELQKKLDNNYPDLKYQDASFKEYGYGATMVYLK